MLKAYKYRLYPTESQAILLAKHFGCVRWIYNQGLEQKTSAYKKGEKLSCFDIAYTLPSVKRENEWLKEVNSQSLQMALRNLDNAYQRFFKKISDFPKFKAKRNKQSFQCSQHSRVSFDDGLLFITKFKEGIKTRFHRKFEGDIKTVTISQNCSGKYFASILVDTKETAPNKPKIRKQTSVGIDLGLKHFAILSNGRKIANPKNFRKEEYRLKILNRRLAKKQKGSKNRNKARVKVAKLHEKIGNRRKDFLHKVSHDIVCDNQTDTICMENLNVGGMLKNRKLSKSISDAGWSSFVEMVKYKAEWCGKNLIFIGRFDPSSKCCNACGNIKSDLTLNDRIYHCEKCGHTEDRDVMAAKNIRDFAMLKEFSGEDFAFEPVERPLAGLGSLGSHGSHGVMKQEFLAVRQEAPVL